MTTQIQRRRGTTAQHSTFTGAVGEVTVDTDKEVLVVHDGAQVGGYPQMRENGSNSALALGSAGTPSLKFAGDTNTGIYSPGADQLALSTNGTGRLFVDASGNVGIGAASAGSKLDVSGVIATNNALYIYNATKDGLGIWYNPGAANISQLTARIAGSDRMTITSAGLVGIGSSSPSNALTVQSTSRPQLHVSYNGNGGIYLTSANDVARTNWQIASSETTANTLQIYPSDSVGSTTFTTPAVTIDASRRVGIGTTTVDFSQFGSNTGGVAIADVGSTNTGLKISDGSYHNYLVQAGNGNFYISHYGAGDTVFSNGTSGEEACRIDASRRLLVGTSTSTAFTRTVIAGNPFGSDGVLTLANTGSTISDGVDLANLQFSDSEHGKTAASVKAVRDGGTWSGTSKPTRLVFSVTRDGSASPTEALRIGNGGTLFSFSGTNESSFLLASANGAGTTFPFIEGKYSATGINTGTASFRVTTNGNVTNTNNSYGSLSDIKLKENIVDASSQWDDIKALQVRRYNFKEGQTHTQIGLVAQEVELVSPGLVTESPDRDKEGNDLGTVTKSVNYSVLYMKAVKALQEAMERIETLEAKVAALEGA